MKNKHVGSTFDSFLEEEGIAEDVENGAVKKLIAFQLRAALENEHISKTELAVRLQTSHAALDRLLDVPAALLILVEKDMRLVHAPEKIVQVAHDVLIGTHEEKAKVVGLAGVAIVDRVQGDRKSVV
jgi:antitoxin HicB